MSSEHDATVGSSIVPPVLRTPAVSYAVFYFIFFSFQAVVLGYFPLHCKAIGLTDFQIAVIASLENIASLTGPLSFSFIISRIQSPIRVLFVAALISATAFLPLLWVHAFTGVFVLYLVALFFNRGVMSLINTWAVKDSVAGVINFGRVRLWGSVGFIAFMMMLGVSVDRYGISSVVGITVFVLFINAASVNCVPTPNRVPSVITVREQFCALSVVLTDVKALFYLAAVATLWGAHGAFFTYFSIYLKALNWSGTDISIAWTVGVVAEIIVFIFFTRLEELFGVYRIFVFSIGTMVLRCLLVSTLVGHEEILLSQILHGFSFGSFYLSSLRLCHDLFPEEVLEQGQALLIAMGGGLGALIGRVLGGVIASTVSGDTGYVRVFLFSAILATGSLILSFQMNTRQGRKGGDVDGSGK